MRYFRIFLLHLQQTFEQRSYMLVFFIMSLINPFIYVLFWQGATSGGRSIIPGWNFSTIASYYFYFAVLNGLLMAHPEYAVSRQIKEGDLVMFLLKPLPYFIQMFFMEFSWRFVRFWFGIITVILFYAFWGNAIIGLHNNIFTWGIICIILFLGFMVSFVIKMIMGVSTFWLIETRGIYDFMEIIFLFFAGFIAPLVLFPSAISSIAINLPFAYIIYFPVIALEGKLGYEEMVHIILIQIFWIGVLFFIYQFLWKKGMQKFTAVGQ
ncbi:MAG TPA: ABC-2 family transporter protein [Candidatus Saccharimonadales bacterium]|nr:ABC-2 family transporter protein [Candidatus Saccharimonadales bacterium]